MGIPLIRTQNNILFRK